MDHSHSCLEAGTKLPIAFHLSEYALLLGNSTTCLDKVLLIVLTVVFLTVVCPNRGPLKSCEFCKGLGVWPGD